MTIQIFDIGASSSASIATKSIIPLGSLIVAGIISDVNSDLVPQDAIGTQYNLLVPKPLESAPGILAVSWGITVADLPLSVIKFPGAGAYTACSAFYATGTWSVSLTQGRAAGKGGSPLATLEGLPWTGCLLFGFLATGGPIGDAFTQDPVFSLPPGRAGASHGTASHNRTIAGGSLIEGSTIVQSYSPVITPRDWAMVVGAFQPA